MQNVVKIAGPVYPPSRTVVQEGSGDKEQEVMLFWAHTASTDPDPYFDVVTPVTYESAWSHTA